jgi:hypothetical protein
MSAINPSPHFVATKHIDRFQERNGHYRTGRLLLLGQK